MNLRDKLLLIDSLREKQVTYPQSHFGTESQSLEDLSLQRCSNHAGDFYFYEQKYATTYLHGEETLGDLLDCDASQIQLLAKDSLLNKIDLSKSIFIDTETTGLAGGSGTYPFLIGLGFFDNGTFCLNQFFMNDLNEEAAILQGLNNLLEKHEMLISYNGKCYDIPLLETRMITQRIPPPLLQMKHLDLLFAIRRLWKHRIGDCSLESAEGQLIKFYRFGDIPGYMIPHIYFRFLRERVTTSLAAVFEHNRLDILSMVSLLSKGLKLISNPLAYCKNNADILALGKVYEGMQRFEESNELYDKFLQKSASDIGKQELLMRKAMNNKKMENWEKAEVLWKKCLDKESFDPMPYIELAKYFEHKKKDYSQAASLVEKALAELALLAELGKLNWLDQQSDLEHRLRRLKRKLSRDSK